MSAIIHSKTALSVEGMMCQKNCGETVRRALLNIQGVESADVSHPLSSAVVTHDSSVSSKVLLDAIDAVGFESSLMENREPLFRIDVGGMMCQKNCAATVQSALRSVSSVSWAAVSFQQREARVWGSDTAASQLLQSVLCAVEAVGFDAKMKTYKGKFCSSIPASGAVPAPIPPPTKAAAPLPLLPPIPPIPTSSSAPSAQKNARELTLCVSGMSCAACLRAVEGGLLGLNGVEGVRAALLSGRVVVLYDGATISSAESVQRIVALGYSAVVLHDKSTLEVAKRRLQLEVTGMSCTSCATNVEQALAKMPGVATVAVSVVTSAALVEVDDTLPHASGPRDLIRAVEGMGYGCKLSDRSASERSDGEGPSDDLLVWSRMLVASLLLGLPVMCLHLSASHFTNVKMAMARPCLCSGGITLGQVIMVALNLPLQFGVGYRFYRGAILGALHGNFGMDFLVVTGTTISFAYSTAQLAFACTNHIPTTHVFFEASGMLLMFVTLGKFMEAYARGKSVSAITNLLKLQPSHALLVSGVNEPMQQRSSLGNLPADAESDLVKHESYGATESGEGTEGVLQFEKIVQIDVNLVQRGDLLKVLPGARIPTDGTVVFGNSYVDESMITGESVAMLRTKGDFVFGSTVNQNGLLYVRVTSIGSESALAQIVHLVEAAQMNKAPVQKYADRIAGAFTPVVLALALLTFAVWAGLAWAHLIPREWFADEYGDPLLFSMLFGISVIVISCPCALGLATPTAIMVGTSVGAANGILIKGGPAFETAHSVDTVIFDKTGTLTAGRPVLIDIFPMAASYADTAEHQKKLKLDIVRLAATAEQGSEHPLATALLAAAKDTKIRLARLQESAFERHDGQGISCRMEEGMVRVGNRLFMQNNSLELHSMLDKAMLSMELQGKTALCVSLDNSVLGVLGIADAPKIEAQSTIHALRKMNIDVWMVTGDNRTTAEAVALAVDIPFDRVIAGAMPADKVSKVEELQRLGRVVAMVGDGINDSPALARADLGIAVGAGTHVAVDAADMVLVRSHLHDVVVALDLARVVFNRIKLNFLWAIIYNIVAIPFAAGIWFPWTHMLVPPQYAGLCMALSSISVVVSSALLRLYQRPQILTDDKAQPRKTLVEIGKRRLASIQSSITKTLDKIRSPQTTQYSSLSPSDLAEADAEGSDDDRNDFSGDASMRGAHSLEMLSVNV